MRVYFFERGKQFTRHDASGYTYQVPCSRCAGDGRIGGFDALKVHWRRKPGRLVFFLFLTCGVIWRAMKGKEDGPQPGASGSLSGRVIPVPEAAVSDYMRLPWFRKSGIMSVLTAVSLFTWCIPVAGAIPILIVCIALATGDIYYCHQARDGGLRIWHRANRWAAFGILGLNGVYLLYLLYRLIQ